MEHEENRGRGPQEAVEGVTLPHVLLGCSRPPLRALWTLLYVPALCSMLGQQATAFNDPM